MLFNHRKRSFVYVFAVHKLFCPERCTVKSVLVFLYDLIEVIHFNVILDIPDKPNLLQDIPVKKTKHNKIYDNCYH